VARRTSDLGGALLALVVAAGTWCYVSGIAPPYPLNDWAFNALLLLCLAFALAFGRANQSSGP
jgi:hypothetical protein